MALSQALGSSDGRGRLLPVFISTSWGRELAVSPSACHHLWGFISIFKLIFIYEDTQNDMPRELGIPAWINKWFLHWVCVSLSSSSSFAFWMYYVLSMMTVVCPLSVKSVVMAQSFLGVFRPLFCLEVVLFLYLFSQKNNCLPYVFLAFIG